MNDPRIPSLKGIMTAKRKTIETIDVDPASFENEIRMTVLRHENVPEREPGRTLEGEVDEQVAELVRLLESEARVL